MGMAAGMDWESYIESADAERPAEPGAGVDDLIAAARRCLAEKGPAHFCEDFGCRSILMLAAQIETLEAELSEIESRGYANLYANELHEQGHQSWMHVPDARRCWCHGHAEDVRP